VAVAFATITLLVVLLVALFGAVGLVALAIAGIEHLGRLRGALERLQSTTAQIRVRGAFLLLLGFVALATELGLEVILGAFLAGAIVPLVDRDRLMTHPQLRLKLEAVGYGVFIPVFFVASGIAYDLGALSEGATVARIPVFLVALLAVRGLPALLYRRLVAPSEVRVAGLLQATSLPFIVAATAIGRELGVVGPENQAALVAAGLLSVVVFPDARARAAQARQRSSTGASSETMTGSSAASSSRPSAAMVARICPRYSAQCPHAARCSSNERRSASPSRCSRWSVTTSTKSAQGSSGRAPSCVMPGAGRRRCRARRAAASVPGAAAPAGCPR